MYSNNTKKHFFSGFKTGAICTALVYLVLCLPILILMLHLSFWFLIEVGAALVVFFGVIAGMVKSFYINKKGEQTITPCKDDAATQLKSQMEEGIRVILLKETGIGQVDTGWYNGKLIAGNPDILFLFGDNDRDKYRTYSDNNVASGGQANAIRGQGEFYDRCETDGGKNGNGMALLHS
ncbi:hypothetical protein [Wolbachia endosymbiont of Ctenocephalides felis wCfeT]|uniref:hypothetical protein n=1 Tax=Wolbachia endosymbiont of Ctenocephalides felis wCfeT TaxID=2732593 RepID=UPI0014455E83|nr:hypothetical protein [Wolbachia endosymbiont of Ctenocephalides felis wCfeT]